MRLPCAVSVLFALPLLSACTSTTRTADNVRVYPQQMVRSATLDIQVFREGRTLSATNTTTRTFGPSTLWLNKRFGKSIDAWQPGQSISLDLNEFYDEFGEQFRGGGFFARETPEDVVLVQLETSEGDTRQLVSLITAGGKARP
jgi:hypothetical protein